MQTVKLFSDSHGGQSGWDGGPFSIRKVWLSSRSPAPAFPIFSFVCLSFIPQLVPSEESTALAHPPSSNEIRDCVFALSKDSAYGPDGFNGSFYWRAWSIIQSDFCLAIQQFFSGCILPISWSSTNLVLIPKSDNPRSCVDYRPISLCNFSNKVISKVLAKRLAPYLDRIISSS